MSIRDVIMDRIRQAGYQIDDVYIEVRPALLTALWRSGEMPHGLRAVANPRIPEHALDATAYQSDVSVFPMSDLRWRVSPMRRKIIRWASQKLSFPAS